MTFWDELSQAKRPLQSFKVASCMLQSAKKVAPLQPTKLQLPHTVLPYVKAYCESSSLHCMHYLVDEKQQRWQKAIWFCIILMTTVAATIVYFELADLYATQRIQTTILNTVHPIFFVPFPSVAICLRNAIDWQRLQQAHLHYMPTVNETHNNETIQAFRRFFAGLEDLRFDRMRHLESLFQGDKSVLKAEHLTLLSGVNLTEVMLKLTLDCTDIFEPNSCYWRKRAYNCCELFILERTEAGFCHVFNSVVSEVAKYKKASNKYYPFHNAKAGDGSGLEVLVKLNASKLQPNSLVMRGIYVIVKQPEQWHDNVRFVDANTYTKIAITPQQTQTDQRTRVVGPEIRGCLFEDERNHHLFKTIPGLLYWRGNCRTRCHQEYLVKKCNCSTSLLFPKSEHDNFTECRAVDFKCLYEHEATFSAERHEAENSFVDYFGLEEAMVCNCLNSCNQLLYTPFFTSQTIEPSDFFVPMSNTTINTITDTTNDNATDNTSSAAIIKWVRLDVYYQSTYMLKYNTNVRYAFVELLANFGGIIGLFLGASLLSAVELGYFLLIALWEHFSWLFTNERTKRRNRCIQHQRHHYHGPKQQKTHLQKKILKMNDYTTRLRY